MVNLDFYLTEEDFIRAEENGISRKTLKTRFYNYAWDKERAITTPFGKGAKHYKYDIKLIELAKKNGIDYASYTTRIRRYNMGHYEAATKPLRFKSHDADTLNLAKRNGISYNTYMSRLFVGWKEFDAATIPTGKIKKYVKDNNYDDIRGLIK